MKHVVTRTAVALGTTLSLSLAAFTFCSLKAPAPEELALSTLGMTGENVQSRMMYSLTAGELRVPSIRSLKAVATGDRAAVAISCFEYLKSSSRTPGFRERYSSYREQHRPATEMISMDPATLNAQREAMHTAISQYEELAKQMNGSTKKELEKAIAAYKSELTKMEHPERSEAMQHWEQEFPAAPEQKIRVVLRQLLDKTAGVDFGATLHKNSSTGKMVFDNPAYESRSAEWKMCYRAGKDATEAVRRYAAQWLSEIK